MHMSLRVVIISVSGSEMQISSDNFPFKRFTHVPNVCSDVGSLKVRLEIIARAIASCFIAWILGYTQL